MNIRETAHWCYCGCTNDDDFVQCMKDNLITITAPEPKVVYTITVDDRIYAALRDLVRYEMGRNSAGLTSVLVDDELFAIQEALNGSKQSAVD